MGEKLQIDPESDNRMTTEGPIVLLHWILEKENQIVKHVSPNVTRIFGYLPQDLTTGKYPLLHIIFEEDRESFRHNIRNNIALGLHFWEATYRIYAKNGDIRFIKTYTYTNVDDLQNIQVYSYIIDQTDLKKEIDLHMSLELRWSAAIDSAREGVWDWDVLHDKIYFSKHWKSMLGFDEHELKNDFAEWESRVHPDDLQKAMADIRAHLENETTFYENEHRLRHKDGTYRWILDRGKAFSRDKTGKATRLIGTHVDITERKEMEYELKTRNKELEQLLEQIKEISITDPLTSLYNRRKMMSEIEREQLEFPEKNEIFSLAILDLDYFKLINDEYGHLVGDEVLVSFSNLLIENVRDEDIVARWGGEEFLVLFPKTLSKDAVNVLERLQSLCSQNSIHAKGETISLSFSAGVCEYNSCDMFHDLIKFADHALYEAKNDGRNSIKLYEKELPRI
ncbi:diguanylate cyclase [Paenisporosarcina cavernae]|uniref:Diguanylate cyclase n=1 Tax=Paenisporosarcina cavernae TaxID=2320858 RepID=A0A385YSH9_9BACL|nr:diguanylate cyclase [Paenisporosarcina cavernae]AYC29474.1 diguanylate cyclase [Paenisporosarcina cavernae]